MSKVHKLLLYSVLHLLFQTPVYAQITPDNTLGKESSVVAPNTTIKGANADLINGGAQRGSNLFHSFTQFNIGDGQRVYFSNPTGVQNIFTRVTGGQASNIFGTLGVNGAANLFFMNPSGILFGKNARLDIAGSFTATTAGSIKFLDGTTFSATAPQNNQLLTISVPIGLQFGFNQPGAIVNTGNLAVNPEHNISLIGSSVAVTGSVLAAGGDINIAAVPDDSLVEINEQGKLFNISSTKIELNASNTFPLIELLKNTAPRDTGLKVTDNNQIELQNGTNIPTDAGTASVSGLIDVSNYQSSKTGGVVRVLGNNVELFNSTTINARGDYGGGTVIIGNDAGVGKLINATKIKVDDHVYIDASAINQGDGGNISVWSNDSTQFFGSVRSIGSINSILNSQGWRYTKTGNSGTVEIGALNNLIYDGIVNTYLPYDLSGYFTVNKTGKLVLNYPKLNIVDTPKADNNQISWKTISNNIKSTNLTLSSNSDVNINNIANNTYEIEVPEPLNIPTELGINSINGSIRFLNAQNTLATNGIGINWIADKDIITGTIRTNAPTKGFSIGGGNAGNIFLTSIRGKIDASAGKLDTATFYNGAYAAVAGKVKLEAYGDIITNDITTLSRNLESNDISIISKAGGIDTSSGSLDARGNYIAPKQYSNGGSITLEADRKIRTGNIYTDGNAGGQINITSHNDGINTTSGKITAFGVIGSVGNVNINSKSEIYAGDIATDFTFNQDFGAVDTRTGKGIENPKGGSINIQGEKFFLNGHTVSANASGKGSGGAISINTSNGITIANGGKITTEVEPQAQGNGGEINLTTNGSLLLENGTRIINSTSGKGDGGKVLINALGGITLTKNSEISTAVASGANGNSGEIDIKTDGQFFLQDNSVIQTSSAGVGSAAKVTLDAKSNINIENGSKVSTQVLSGSVGNGSDINLRTGGKLSLINGSQLRSNTSTNGNAGNINITAPNAFYVSGSNENNGESSGLFTSTLTSGKGGDIAVNTENFKISDGAVLNAQTRGSGLAGSVTINTSNLDVINGGQIVSSTFGSGNSGNITINARSNALFSGSDNTYLDRLNLFGKDSVVNTSANSGLFTESQGTGIGGKLTINTPKLQVEKGAFLSASTLGQGTGGTLEINASEGLVTVDGIGSSLITDTRGAKNAGNLTVNTGQLQIFSGGKISASTSGQGTGGTLQVNATNGTVKVIGTNSQLSAQSSSDGTAGNLNITTGQLQVKDSGLLTVSARNATAGNINIAADNINLSNQAKITAETGAGNGGNIIINSKDLLLMRRNSDISTTAGTQQKGGDGGDININARFIVAVPTENSDITADAFTGRGGKVDIRAQSILGITAQPKPSPTSDITASSELGVQGQVLIQQPEVQPQQGLIELPEEVIDATRKIAQFCPREPGAKPNDKFIITGRGGLPPSPYDTLTPDAIALDFITLNSSSHDHKSPPVTSKPKTAAPNSIVEATEWVVDKDGDVVLTANASTTPLSASSSSCH